MAFSPATKSFSTIAPTSSLSLASEIAMLRRLFLALIVCLAGLLPSCATTEKTAQKKQLKNPGDELNVRPWAQGTRASHFATPMGMPMTH